MSNDVLNSLLREYEKKKLYAELDLENRKKELYKKEPRLEKIEDQLNKNAIIVTRNILSNLNNSLDSFNDITLKLKKERKEILDKLHLDDSYLKPFYECNLCNDTGYITDENYRSIMCPCLKQKLLDISFNKSNMSNLDKENFNTFDENLFSDKVNIKKYNRDISPRENIINIKNKCIEFVDNFNDPSTKNLLFSGNTGLR